MVINSRRLVELRGDRSQRDIERETGISQSTISGYESGEAKRPDRRNLRKLAEFYGVPVDEIYSARPTVRPVPRGDQSLQELVLAWTELTPDLQTVLLETARELAGIARRRAELADPQAGDSRPPTPQG